MLTHNLGYPRIGNHRELKKANEAFWAGKISLAELEQAGKDIRKKNWQLQKSIGIDWIPCNDFSFYDQMLDMSLMTGCIPQRFRDLMADRQMALLPLELGFAMARGYQQKGYDISAMEMTKWFDTNYHFIVPEFVKEQEFSFFDDKIVREYLEAIQAGVQAIPVLTGPVTFLKLGKERGENFNKYQLLDKLLPVFEKVLNALKDQGARFVQIDEPCLSLDLTDEENLLMVKAYSTLRQDCPGLSIVLSNYFGEVGKNLNTLLQLPIDVLHLDLVRGKEDLAEVLNSVFVHSDKSLSLGLIDGRNIWRNDLDDSLQVIEKVEKYVGPDRIWIAPSCSLLHVPCDLDDETELPDEVRQWLSFGKQKLEELVLLKQLASGQRAEESNQKLEEVKVLLKKRKSSCLIHNKVVQERLATLNESFIHRKSPFRQRKARQQQVLHLPQFPTTTIGSFPQTREIRSMRAKWRKGEITESEYDQWIKSQIASTIKWQEEAGLDVLVHGEYERNDMVEYFGEQLHGFLFTHNGWVQSYGSRCVKPPVIFGDVFREHAMTVEWSSYAQSLTQKWVKGMLTGPVTILEWSFVRDDQPLEVTATQIALAIRDEVLDLENAGIKIIQIDEPAFREGLPLKRENWKAYLQWAEKVFRIASCGVKDETQIHTHMCYSEFNDIIDSIARLDADVITIETSRSQMELLDAFSAFRYPNDIGPGVYDIHSPRVPEKEEMVTLLKKAEAVIPADQLWVNPDCGLKTRTWPETEAALREMVSAAKELRAQNN